MRPKSESLLGGAKPADPERSPSLDFRHDVTSLVDMLDCLRCGWRVGAFRGWQHHQAAGLSPRNHEFDGTLGLGHCLRHDDIARNRRELVRPTKDRMDSRKIDFAACLSLKMVSLLRLR